MKGKEFCKRNKKKVIIIAVSLVTVLVIVAGVAVYCIRKGGTVDMSFGFGGGKGGFAMSGNMVGASGVTSVGMVEESFEVENLTVELEIEEVYVSSGDSVEAGGKVLKLSAESVADARAELEQVLQDADLAYRAGAIEYEQNKITAKYDYDSEVLAGEQAQEIYEETLSGLEATVTRAEEELAEAREQIAEYEAYVKDDSYRAYFKVDEYQEIYDENLRILTDKMDEWGVTWEQVTSGAGGGNFSGGAGGMSSGASDNMNVSSGSSDMGDFFGMDVSASMDISGGTYLSSVGDMSGSAEIVNTSSVTVSGGDAVLSDISQYVSALKSLYSVLEQNLQDLEQAQSDYEDAVANAAFELQTLELNLPSLEQAVLEAQESYETQVLQAKLTYETSLASAESAESNYETAMEKAESDYETLKDDWEDAKENLELFEKSVGDGYFYASGDGTIFRAMVRAGQSLTSNSVIFIYSNPEEISVTVSVDQAEIANIALGDTATIQSTDYGTFEGEVTALNPVSSSSSRTSVTYEVTVTLTGEVGELPANESVTVIFGMEDMTMPEGMGENGELPTMPEGAGENGELPVMPEGAGENGELPAMPEGVGENGGLPTMPEGVGENGENPTM